MAFTQSRRITAIAVPLRKDLLQPSSNRDGGRGRLHAELIANIPDGGEFWHPEVTQGESHLENPILKRREWFQFSRRAGVRDPRRGPVLLLQSSSERKEVSALL